MSGVPILVEASGLRVLVVGGGAVAARKAAQFVAAGADVRVVSVDVCSEVAALGVSVAVRPYESTDIGDAELVVAATNVAAVNALVAADARAAHRLVNVADAGDAGSFAMMAAHRSGPLTIAVSAGGVPAAGARIRDALARRFDGRYAVALTEARMVRDRLIGAGDASRWRECSAAVMDDRFCEAVETDTFAERLAPWR